MRILINGTILDNNFWTFPDVKDLFQSGIEKVDLQIEGPPGHVFIKIIQIGVVLYVFIDWVPIVMLSQFFGQGCFSCTNISRNSYMLDLFFFVDDVCF